MPVGSSRNTKKRWSRYQTWPVHAQRFRDCACLACCRAEKKQTDVFDETFRTPGQKRLFAFSFFFFFRSLRTPKILKKMSSSLEQELQAAGFSAGGGGGGSQGGGGGKGSGSGSQEAAQQQADARNAMLKQILTPEAKERRALLLLPFCGSPALWLSVPSAAMPPQELLFTAECSATPPRTPFSSSLPPLSFLLFPRQLSACAW